MPRSMTLCTYCHAKAPSRGVETACVSATLFSASKAKLNLMVGLVCQSTCADACVSN